MSVPLAECPHCGRLVAEQIPGAPIMCPTCGSTSPDVATWNRRAWASAAERSGVVATARGALPERTESHGMGRDQWGGFEPNLPGRGQAPNVHVCGFDLAWVGKCSAIVEAPGSFCASHARERCWCGAQATRQCTVAGSLVCGAPLCAEHGCANVSSGLTGSSGAAHSEAGRTQFMAWRSR